MEELALAILDLEIHKCIDCNKDTTKGVHDETGFRCTWCLPEKTGITWIEEFK